MSSLFNQTTGECISGTCKAVELFSQYKPILFGIEFVAGILVLVGIILIKLGSKKKLKELEGDLICPYDNLPCPIAELGREENK